MDYFVVNGYNNSMSTVLQCKNALQNPVYVSHPVGGYVNYSKLAVVNQSIVNTSSGSIRPTHGQLFPL